MIMILYCACISKIANYYTNLRKNNDRTCQKSPIQKISALKIPFLKCKEFGITSIRYGVIQGFLTIMQRTCNSVIPHGFEKE